MDIGRRSQYRVELGDADGLRMSVRSPDGSSILTQLLDVSASGAGARFTPPNWPSLAVGQLVDLVFNSDTLQEPLTVPATVQHRSEEEDARRYGFRFIEPQQLDAHLPPDVRKLFNRRKTVRVEPDDSQPINVGLGPGRDDPTMEAHLHNVSTGGARISVEAGMDLAFADTTTVTVALHLPNRRRPLVLVAHLRYRQLVGRRIYYGLEFDGKQSESFAKQQRLIAKYVVKRQQARFRGAA